MKLEIYEVKNNEVIELNTQEIKQAIKDIIQEKPKTSSIKDEVFNSNTCLSYSYTHSCIRYKR